MLYALTYHRRGYTGIDRGGRVSPAGHISNRPLECPLDTRRAALDRC